MAKATQNYPSLVGIKIFCPNLQKEVDINIDYCYILGWSCEDEDYSDSGYNITVDKCECGKTHKIKN